MVWRLDTDQ